MLPPPAPTSHPIPTGATGDAVKRLRDAIEGECGGNWISEKQAAAVLAHLGISAPAAGDALDVILVALQDLHALVWGECPSLLNEDSGGNSALDIQVREAIEAAQSHQKRNG